MKREDTNIYMPFKAVIKEVIDTGCEVKLFKVVPKQKIDYLPGQFFMVSQWGVGGVPISVTSTKAKGFQRHIEFGIRKVGSVTTALHKLKKGDNIWLRGPYGNGFGTDIAKKRDVIFIAGGIGILPLRSLINSVLLKKSQFGRLFLLYGSKNPSEILFISEITVWKRKGLEIVLTVDVKDKDWKGNVGVVTEHLGKVKTNLKNAYSYICGPKIMIEKTMGALSIMGMPDSQIITTLEARMKCGIGKCGQCYHGAEYICTNGPVYTYGGMKERGLYA